jgi:hypothetical protein
VKPEASGDRFPVYAGMMAGVGLLGVLGAYFLPSEAGDRLGAFVGVGAATLSGAVALPLKQRAVAKSVQDALKVMGAVFGLRVVLVLVGVWVTQTRGAGAIAFTVGFFGSYFVMQWIEIAYLLAEQKRRGSK